ncbi:hypothetical protein Sango_0217000 [Sesamum angolense]|uniref:CCHC-type domain-containing protein n=1 Tax=Sesamum angolense TaxID=2727404 RepID=A0AAE2C7E8_9LAMI|nr:hypothetical protein Sango_0217000 [Sesamum angolense]
MMKKRMLLTMIGTWMNIGIQMVGGGPSYPVFNPEETYDPTFDLGMMFSNKAEFKKALQSYAIKSKRTLKFIKNDKVRIYAKCGDANCEWKMHAIKVRDEETFQINLLNDHHSCPQIFEVKNVKTNWIKDKYLQKFKSDPKRNVKGFRVDIINELRYSRLWDYSEEIRKTNPGSTVIVGTEQVDGEERFSRFYVCFGALKAGFKAGCRPIIGVDGCHLKGPNGGILLTAIGLMQAFEEVFPGCDHRFCVRHLHNNFKQAGFRGLAFKNALWNAAKSCTVGEWKMRMQEMKNLSQQAYDWFNDKPAVQWSRSHFSEASSCDMLLNNVCETFNACILDAREKPILTMLEWIREYLMRRMQENRDKSCTKWKDKLCPKIQQILQKHANKDPKDYVADCYSVDTYRRVYKLAILPMSHEGMWSESCIIPPIPPNFGRRAGRPAKARRRESDEPTLKNKQKSKRKQVQKIKRHQTTVHCRTCGEPGHNTAKCPERVPLATQEMTEATIKWKAQVLELARGKHLQMQLTELKEIGTPQLEHKVLTFPTFATCRRPHS